MKNTRRLNEKTKVMLKNNPECKYVVHRIINMFVVELGYYGKDGEYYIGGTADVSMLTEII